MTVLEILVKQLDEQASYLREGLSLGRVSSFEEYKGTCGEIKGLLVAKGYILDLMQHMETSDD
jgi:hypothetical protein